MSRANAQKTLSLADCRDALIANGFEAYVATGLEEARQVFLGQILPTLKVKTFAWGDSLTMEATGILTDLLAAPDLEAIKTFEPGVPRREMLERRRQALLSDLFVTGSNAVTACGKLVNLDMVGNRTAAISFGPKQVVLFVGRNKLVPDLDSAIGRVRQVAAPQNAARHHLDTPCATSGRCHDCSSPQRICNVWSIVEKSFPAGRIKVILIDADLGL